MPCVLPGNIDLTLACNLERRTTVQDLSQNDRYPGLCSVLQYDLNLIASIHYIIAEQNMTASITFLTISFSVRKVLLIFVLFNITISILVTLTQLLYTVIKWPKQYIKLSTTITHYHVNWEKLHHLVAAL